MGRLGIAAAGLGALLTLCTCSFSPLPPELSVKVSLSSPAATVRSSRTNPELADMGCYLITAVGNGDEFTDSDTGGLPHSCLHLAGRASTLVSYAAVRSGVVLSLPQGTYSFEVVGVYTGSSCAGKSVRQIFNEGMPQVFSIGATGASALTAGARATITSTYSSATASNYAQACSQAISAWDFVDGGGDLGLNRDSVKDASSPQMAAYNAKLYLIWSEQYSSSAQIRASVYNGVDATPTWTSVDGNPLTGLNHDPLRPAVRPRMLLFNNKLYATWSEASITNQIRVTVYNGNDSAPVWAFVDGNGTNGLNKSTTNPAATPQLTEFNSKLYLIWTEVNGGVNQVRVAVYNGIDGAPVWSFVDGNGANGINHATGFDANSPQLTVSNSKLYATWAELNGSGKTQVRAFVYNGNDSSPTFTAVDGNAPAGLNANTDNDASGPQLAAFNSKLYLAWSEFDGQVGRIRIKVYNGQDIAPIWTLIDGGGLIYDSNYPGTGAATPQFTVFNSRLYLTWSEKTAGNSHARAVIYNGDDLAPAWNYIDGNGIKGLNLVSGHAATSPQLAVFGSKLYLTFLEQATSPVAQVRALVGR